MLDESELSGMARGGVHPYLSAMMTARDFPAFAHRATQLAGSGAYRDWTGVAKHLREEGYADAEAVLGERSLRVQIDLACEKASRV